jgi:hypothetical protein
VGVYDKQAQTLQLVQPAGGSVSVGRDAVSWLECLQLGMQTRVAEVMPTPRGRTPYGAHRSSFAVPAGLCCTASGSWQLVHGDPLA